MNEIELIDKLIQNLISTMSENNKITKELLIKEEQIERLEEIVKNLRIELEEGE